MSNNPQSEWELLQSVIINGHNKEVNEYFKNTPTNDFESHRSKLKRVCLTKDDDSALMLILRLWLFEILLKKRR